MYETSDGTRSCTSQIVEARVPDHVVGDAWGEPGRERNEPLKERDTAGTSPSSAIRRIHANMGTRTDEGKSMERSDEPRLAVLIDADNTAPKWAEPIFEEIATLGELLQRVCRHVTTGEESAAANTASFAQSVVPLRTKSEGTSLKPERVYDAEIYTLTVPLTGLMPWETVSSNAVPFPQCRHGCAERSRPPKQPPGGARDPEIDILPCSPQRP